MRREPLARYLVQVSCLLLVLAAWAYATRTGGASPLVLSPPSEVFAELIQLLGESETYEALRLTSTEVIIAIAIAISAGGLVGVAAGGSRFLRDLIEPVILALYAVPIVLAFPMCVLVFGIGSHSKIAFAALFAFFPVAIHTLKGMAYVDGAYLRVAAAMGASRREQLIKIRFRAAIPTIMVGLRIAFVGCYLAVVAGEMLVSTGGLGRQVRASIEIFETSRAYAWIVIAVLLAVVLMAFTGVVGRFAKSLQARRHTVHETPSQSPRPRNAVGM